MSQSAESERYHSMEEAGQVVFQAVHSIWEDWSHRSQQFPGERPEMQCAFQNHLSHKLPAWSVKRPGGWPARRGGGLPSRYSAWTAYDIGVFVNGDWPVALVELSFEDTNVAHALHNGESKLLGNCDGLAVSTERPFWVERGLEPGGIATVQRRLQSIPLRGLFFVGPGAVLDEREEATWHETKQKGFSGETKFWSALFASQKTATLCQIFHRLAEEGLYCWFYSLCAEDKVECLPGRTPLCQRRPGT